MPKALGNERMKYKNTIDNQKSNNYSKTYKIFENIIWEGGGDTNEMKSIALYIFGGGGRTHYNSEDS